MILRPRRATPLAAALGLLLGACTGSLYDAAGVPKVDVNGCDVEKQHVCEGSNVCRSNTDPEYCGTACVVCGPAPLNGERACLQGPGGGFACGFTCPDVPVPTRACQARNACLPDDVNACGTSCQDCNAVKPAGTVATCIPGGAGNECAYACAAGWFACASGCCQPAAVAAGGDESCAIASDGGLLCWGANVSGQLGRAGPGGPIPRLVTGLGAGVTAVAVGGAHACAVKDGTVWCWGSDALGQLGDGPADSSGPSPVSTGLLGATQLVAGNDHTCALVGGGVRCWGANVKGQLGTGAAGAPVTAPPSAGLAGLTGVTMLAAAGDTTCALAGTTVRCWGANGSGQAGAGSLTTPQPAPVAVALPATATFVAVGGAHACAGVTGNGIMCWGANEAGQLGTGTPSAAPSTAAVKADRIDNGTGALLAAAGSGHTCGAKDAAELICNGRNDKGQAGVADMTVPALGRITVALGGGLLEQAAAGREHTCALVDAGLAGRVIRCWGRNAEGQLGRETQALPSPDAAPVPPAP